MDKHRDGEGKKDSDVDDGDYDWYDRLIQLCYVLTTAMITIEIKIKKKKKDKYKDKEYD